MTEKNFEKIMEAACECCRWPFFCKSQEALDDKCEVCPVYAVLEETEDEEPRNVTIQIDQAVFNETVYQIVREDVENGCGKGCGNLREVSGEKFYPVSSKKFCEKACGGECEKFCPGKGEEARAPRRKVDTPIRES